MTGSTVAGSVELRVPASSDALSLVRLFAASIGRQLDLADEVVEDMKLALSEVCAAAIEAAGADDEGLTVEASWTMDPLDVDIRVSSFAAFSTGDPASDDRARLLDALGLRPRATDDRRAVEFSLPTSSLR